MRKDEEKRKRASVKHIRFNCRSAILKDVHQSFPSSTPVFHHLSIYKLRSNALQVPIDQPSALCSDARDPGMTIRFQYSRENTWISQSLRY